MALTKTKKSVIDISSFIGGNNSHVQFNSNDEFGYSDNFIWDNTNNLLQVSGIKIGGSTSNPFGGRKNLFINGNLDFWTRGTSLAHDNTENDFWVKYLPDMFRTLRGNNYGVDFTISQSTDIPGLSATGNFTKSRYSYKITCDTPATPSVDDDGVALQYVIEGNDFKTFCNTDNTLSFWTKTNKLGTYCASFQTVVNNNINESIVEEFTSSELNAWEYQTVSIDSSSFDMNRVGVDEEAAMIISIWFANSNDTLNNSKLTDSTSTSLSGDYVCTANQGNIFTTINNYMNIAQLQFERGENSTTLEFRSTSTELQDVQRYCKSSYPLGTTPGTSGSTTNVCIFTQAENPHSAGDEDDIIIGSANFPVTMRTTPTVTIYRPSTGVEDKLEDYWGTLVTGDVESVNVGQDGIKVIKLDTAHQFDARVPYQFHYLADANFYITG